MSPETISFFITERCNQKCEYCDVSTIKNPKDLNIDLFREYIDLINTFDLKIINLGGGEPGLVPEKYLDEIFEKTRLKINVFTNGEFIKRGYDIKYKNKIFSIKYHIVEKMEYTLKSPNDNYIFVVHKQNIEEAKDLKKRFPKEPIIFTPFILQRNRKDFILDKEDYKRLEQFPGLFKIAELLEKNSRTTVCEGFVKRIDFVSNTIWTCCLSFSSPRIELNRENLLKIGTSMEKVDRFKDCDFCIYPFLLYSNPTRLGCDYGKKF
jgi:sulfatase maturation enzyme AslB (radical SAM superfamily)